MASEENGVSVSLSGRVLGAFRELGERRAAEHKLIMAPHVFRIQTISPDNPSPASEFFLPVRARGTEEDIFVAAGRLPTEVSATIRELYAEQEEVGQLRSALSRGYWLNGIYLCAQPYRKEHSQLVSPEPYVSLTLETIATEKEIAATNMEDWEVGAEAEGYGRVSGRYDKYDMPILTDVQRYIHYTRTVTLPLSVLRSKGIDVSVAPAA